MRRARLSPRHYVLGPDARTPRRASFSEWAVGFEAACNREPFEPRPGDGWARVAHDETGGGVRVSTVFLGLDHSFGFGDRLLLFETMIFGGSKDGYQERYSTWDEAEAGHAAALLLVSH